MKPLFFVGSSRDDIREFPEAVKDATGFALYLAQMGDRVVDFGKTRTRRGVRGGASRSPKQTSAGHSKS